MSCCAVVDLRQYTVHPGRRDDLVDVFDSHLVDGQEAVGMHIVGQFRDLDDPERFVWMRGFPDLATRAAASQAFYTGPVWREHGPKANVTMVDSDNVVMLRPIRLHPDYPTLDAPRGSGPDGTLVSVTVHHRRSVDDGFAEFYGQQIEPVLMDTGGMPVAGFETLDAENNFPALPSRSDRWLSWWRSSPTTRRTRRTGRRWPPRRCGSRR